MSDENQNSQTKQELEAQMKARFADLDAKNKEDLEKQAQIKASYHHSKEQDIKDDRAQVEASAAEDRKIPKIDPLELIRQVNKMREEGFDEATIRAAFDEVMESQTGKSTRDRRRIVRSPGMVAMMSPDDEIKYYERRELDYRHGGRFSQEEIDEILNAISVSKQASNQILEYQKPTIKNYIFRGILFVVRRPLQFVINFLTAYRTVKYQSKNDVYPDIYQG